jgi:hypothetical protein
MSTSDQQRTRSTKASSQTLRLWAFGSFIMLSINVLAQQIDSDHLPMLKDWPVFNSDYIRSQNIHQIELTYSYKDNLQPIVFISRKELFHFEASGKLAKWEIWADSNKIRDKEVWTYYFEDDNRLKAQHYRYRGKLEVERYSYNDSGLIEEIRHLKSSSCIENFKYEYYHSRQYRQFALNDEDRTYRSTVVNLDENGRIKSETSRLVRGYDKTELLYWYDDEGRLIEKQEHIRGHVRSDERYVAVYENDTLQSHDYYENGDLVWHMEFLYKNGLLEHILRRYANTGRIEIMELTYKFY